MIDDVNDDSDRLEDSNKKLAKLKLLTISSHNKRLGSNQFKIKTKVKFRNCGWEIYKVDLKAAQDFNALQIYIWREQERIVNAKLLHENNDIKDIFTYALRYSIPSIFYQLVLDNNEGLPQIRLTKEEIEKIMVNYNNFVRKKSCYVTDKYDYLTERYSWKLCEVDYYAATLFKRVSGLTYKEIMKNALRTYLNQINYNHAQEMIELSIKHIEEHLKEGDRYE